MSEGLDIQIRVMTQNAKREVQQFVQNARRELQQGLRTNMGGGSGGNAAKDPFTAGMRAGTQKMKDEQREREGILKKAAADQQRIAEQSAKRSLARQRKAALDQQKIDEQTAKRSLARQRKAALEQQKIAERSAKRSLAQQKRDSVAANSAAEQQAKIEESAANRAVIAWRVASAEIQKLRNRAVATAATPTRTSGHGRQDAITNREKSVLLAMAANSDTPIQSVIAQQKKVDSLIQSGAARRLRFIREREESAVQLRKRSQKDAEHAANQQAKAEEKAAQRAAAAWRAANKQVAALDQERRAAIGRATKAQGRGGRAGAVVDREAATLIGMASDRSVPIEKVRAQEAKLTAMVAASERKRLSIVRQSEEQAVRARKAGAEAVYNVERIKNAKLRSAARNVQAEMLAAARSGDASQIARAERLGQSLVTIKRRNSRDIINTIIQQEAAAGKISTKRAAEMMATQNHMAKGAGRNAIYLFQFQQAIEDSAAALNTGQGFTGVIRSAGNNLALMASLLGGTTGTVALVGLMAVGVGSLTHSLLKMLDGTKQMNEASKRQNELLREELQLRLELAGQTAKAAEQAARDAAGQAESDADSQRRENLREAIQDIIRGGAIDSLTADVAAEIRKQAQAAQKQKPFGGFPDELGAVLRAADDSGRLSTLKQEINLQKDVLNVEKLRIEQADLFIRKRSEIEAQLTELAGNMGQGTEEFFKLERAANKLTSEFKKANQETAKLMMPFGAFDEGMAKEAIDGMRESLKESTQEMESQERVLLEIIRHVESNADAKARLLVLDAKSDDFTANLLASILQQNEAVKAQLAFRERLRDVVTAEEEANRRMMTEAEKQKADAKAELDRADKHLTKEKERLAAIQDEAQRQKELAKAEEERDKAAEKYKQTVEDIDRLESERKSLQQEILNAKREELREDEKRSGQLEREIEQIKEKIAQLAKARQSSRDAFETSAFDVVRNRTQDMTKNQAEVAKSQLSPFLPPEVRNFYGQVIDQQFAQLAKARDDALLEMRGKFLSDQAAKAGQSGDFDRQRDLLQELQGLQMGVAGNDPNLARARAAFEAAKETQKAIEATFQQQAEAENERMRQLLESNQRLVDALNRLQDAIVNMEREARGLPPEDLPPGGGPPRDPVVAPRPPVVAPESPKPPVVAPKPLPPAGTPSAPNVPVVGPNDMARHDYLFSDFEFQKALREFGVQGAKRLQRRQEDGEPRVFDRGESGFGNDLFRAGREFREAVNKFKQGNEDPLAPLKDDGVMDQAERDPNIQAINQNTQKTGTEVVRHSAKTDTTNAILRELVAVQRQIAATPPTIIVAGGGGGGGFPMPTFPGGGFPGGGGGGGPIRPDDGMGFGGFGGALASVASSNTFGTVNINVNSMGQAQGLFRDFTLASNASSLRAGR